VRTRSSRCGGGGQVKRRGATAALSVARETGRHVVSGKPPRKLWKIGDIVRHTGLSRQTVHNYTILGLITEVERTESGHRLFGDAVFKRLADIERHKAQGKSLADIARLVAPKGERAKDE
jgi:hypothetical protein